MRTKTCMLFVLNIVFKFLKLNKSEVCFGQNKSKPTNWKIKLMWNWSLSISKEKAGSSFWGSSKPMN